MGEFIVPVPFVKQVKVYTHFLFVIIILHYKQTLTLFFTIVVKLSNLGGRLIIASDGIWDALSSEVAAKTCRGLPAELAARQVVKVSECFLTKFCVVLLCKQVSDLKSFLRFCVCRKR